MTHKDALKNIQLIACQDSLNAPAALVKNTQTSITIATLVLFPIYPPITATSLQSKANAEAAPNYKGRSL